MDLVRLPPRVLLVLAIGAGLVCQLLLGTSYLAASLDPLEQEGGVPIAVLVLDVGPHGDRLLAELQGRASPVEWVKVPSREGMEEGLREKTFYGALVVPRDFSASLDSFASDTPRAAQVETWTNPGASTSGAIIAGRAIEIALEAVRDVARDEALRGAQVASSGIGALSLDQGRWLAAPIVARAEVANAVPSGGANGLAPTYLAMAAWIGGYLGSVALERFRAQTGLGALGRGGLVAGAAVFQGALATGAAIAVGLAARDAVQLALVLALGTWMSYAVVSLLMDVFGLAGILPAFAVLALGLPASGAIYPAGLLPDLYRALHAADPFTWLVEMLRTTLYAPQAGDLTGYALATAGLALACTAASLALGAVRTRRQGTAL